MEMSISSSDCIVTSTRRDAIAAQYRQVPEKPISLLPSTARSFYLFIFVFSFFFFFFCLSFSERVRLFGTTDHESGVFSGWLAPSKEACFFLFSPLYSILLLLMSVFAKILLVSQQSIVPGEMSQRGS